MRTRLNDTDRKQWVENDEGLYDWWRQSRQPLRQFVRDNRQEIDGVIQSVLTGEKMAHYLKYGE